MFQWCGAAFLFIIKSNYFSECNSIFTLRINAIIAVGDKRHHLPVLHSAASAHNKVHQESIKVLSEDDTVAVISIVAKVNYRRIVGI